MDYLEKLCDNIDAAIFSSDYFVDAEKRAKMREMMARWERGLKEHDPDNNHPGVDWHEDQRDNGPFSIRIGGSNNFVTKIDPDDQKCHPPGSVDLIAGRNHPDVLTWDSLDEALAAASQVFEIEGFHNSIELTMKDMRTIKANTVVRQIESDCDVVVEKVEQDKITLDTGDEITASEFVENGGSNYRIIRERPPTTHN